MSNPGVNYVWGWDPKDNTDNDGLQGAVVGWTFKKTSANAECIVWVSKDEAFLECVKPYCGGKLRVSAGFFGLGQWAINNPPCPTLKPTRQ